MEKVTIQRDIADAIELYIADSNGSKERLLRDHALVNEWFGSFKALNKIDLMTLASALINGYETEQSPLDKINEYFAEHAVELESAEEGSQTYVYCDGVTEGVYYTLNMLGIRIEGINA